MAKEANLKLTLNASGFSQSIDGLKTKVRAFGGDVKKYLGGSFGQDAVAGIKGAGGALAQMGSQLKGQISMAATLGGAVGIGAMVKRAVEMREKVRDVQFQIEKAGKSTADWQGLMEDVHKAADRTGQSSGDLADILQSLHAATGDADFARAALEPIGHAAQASGQDVLKLGDAAQMLYRKFGANAETLPEMLAVFVEKSDAGGLSLDALGNKFALLAGEAEEAGFKGADGLSSLLGMLETLDSRVGEKAEPALKKMFQVLKTGSKDLKALGKESGIKFGADDTATEKLRKIMGSEKGRKKFAEKLGGESRVVFDELSEPFNKAFAASKAAGMKTAQATEQGLASFDASMELMSKRTLEYAKIVEESKAGQEEDPIAKLNKAVDKIAQAFTKPEMMDAIDKLSEMLPQLAQGLVKTLNFIVNNPLASGAMLVGGKMAMGAAGGFAGNVANRLGDKASEKGAKLFGDIASGVIAKDGAKRFAEAVATNGGWAKTAGQFGMIAGAALLAFQAGKEVIDNTLNTHFDDRAKTSDIINSAESMTNHGVGSEKDRRATAEALKARIAKMEKDGGPSVSAKLFGNMANTFGDAKHPVTEFNEQLKRAKESLAALENSKAAKGSDELGTAASKAAKGVETLANALSKVELPAGTPTGSSKGPGGPANKGNVPGHGPVGG